RAFLPFQHLTELLRKQKRSLEARKLFDEWLAAHRAQPGPFLADALTVYAGFLHHEDSDAAQRAVLEEAVDLYRQEPTPPYRHLCVNCFRDLGWNYHRAGRDADVEKIALEYQAAAARRYGPRSNQVAYALNQRAVAQLTQRKSGPDVETALTE